MKKISAPLAGGILILILANWGASQESEDGSVTKNKRNVIGELTTREDVTYPIENGSIGRLVKNISLYQMPAAPHLDAAKHQLKVNPAEDLVITKADLCEIAEILVPSPEVVWEYIAKDGHRSVKYIEITVILNGKKPTKTSYLIEARKKFYCDKTTNGIVEEQEVPLQAIKRLVLKECLYREEQETKKKKNNRRMLAQS